MKTNENIWRTYVLIGVILGVTSWWWAPISSEGGTLVCVGPEETAECVLVMGDDVSQTGKGEP